MKAINGMDRIGALIEIDVEPRERWNMIHCQIKPCSGNFPILFVELNTF